MKKHWIIGGVLFVSIALNVTLGAMLTGKHYQEQRQRIEIVMERIAALPEIERANARTVLLQAVPDLRNRIRELRQARKEMRHYVASDTYSRTEAEKRLTDLRVKTTELQLVAQKMMLDIADKLPPQYRAQLFDQSDDM